MPWSGPSASRITSIWKGASAGARIWWPDVVLVYAVVLGVMIGLLLGGDIREIASVRLRRLELFYAAFGMQIVAFPFTFLPWQTSDTVGVAIWLASYGVLAVATASNLRLRGVAVIGLGMASNFIAVFVNGGHMPSLPHAVKDAGGYAIEYNSALIDQPVYPWLVDRWPVPDWLPLGNVFSIGDVLIGFGALVLTISAMGVGSVRAERRTRAGAPMDAVRHLDHAISLLRAFGPTSGGDVAPSGPLSNTPRRDPSG
jgi:hypothetical protein